MKTPLILLNDIIVSDESGFACSKTKLVANGLIHLRPFNLTNSGELSFDQIYRVPLEEVPNGKEILEEGDILFNNTNSAELVGKAALVEQPMKAGFSNHLTRIRVDQARVMPQFVVYWLHRTRDTGYFSAHATQWVSQAAFKSSELRRMEMPLPSIEEQRRIVDILSRAEGIVRLRRESQKKTAELIPALFVDMFGDPAMNPKGWQAVSLGSVIEEFRYGTSQKSGPTGYPTLRIPNVIGDRLDPSEIKFVAAPDGEAQRLRLHDGDLLFVRTNGNRDYVGRSAVFNAETMRAAGFDPENCLYASYLIRGRIRRGVLSPHYLQTFLSSVEGRRRLKERCRTSAGQYNINIDGLSNIALTLPPLDKQVAFERRCHDVFSIRDQQSAATQKAEATFGALLARTFNKIEQ